MAETYCGKTCADCAQKEQLKCPGCKAGPGRQVHGDCELAKCCRLKGHQECATCDFHENCHSLRGKHNMAERRLKAIEEENARYAAFVRKAPRLSRWLFVMFWLIVPSTIASAMSSNFVADAFPAIMLPGAILSIVCNLVYTIALLNLAKEEERYRTAGICGIINVIISVLILYTPQSGTESLGDAVANLGFTLLFALAAIAVGLIGRYNEFTAHSVILTGLNNTLADKWAKLWKWYIGSMGAILASIFIPFIGALALIAAAIALVVVSILQLIYLYQTAKTFRDIVC